MAIIVGTVRGDKLIGTEDDDSILGLAGDDSLSGLAGNDTLDGDKGLDALFGGDGRDLLLGGNKDDSLDGGSGNDRLYGGDDDDYLFGGAGNDKLYGGVGRDTLFGGANGIGGKDKFIFTSALDGDDVIGDFEQGRDHIVFKKEALNPDGDLTFVGTAAFSGDGRGEISYRIAGDNSVTEVFVDIDGDFDTEMRITLAGAYTLTADDFIAG